MRLPASLSYTVQEVVPTFVKVVSGGVIESVLVAAVNVIKLGRVEVIVTVTVAVASSTIFENT